MSNITSSAEPTVREFFYYRQRQRNRIFQLLAAHFSSLAKAEGLTQKKLASLARKDPGSINRWLKSPSNLELDTISDLLLAMGAEMDFQIEALPNMHGEDTPSQLSDSKPEVNSTSNAHVQFTQRQK